MQPALEDYSRQLESANAEALALIDAHPPERLQKRPHPDRWSAAEHLDHIASAVREYLPAIDDAIATGRAKGMVGEGPFRYGLVAKLVIRFTEPPVWQRFRTPASFSPSAGVTAKQAVAAMLARHAELLRRMEQSDGLDLAAVKVTSPANARLKLPLGAAFAMLAAHARRHLWHASKSL